MAQSYRVEAEDGQLAVFSRDRLFLSVYDALRHRDDAVASSTMLVETIIAAIQKHNRLFVPRDELITTVATVIKRFDKTAYVRYVSMN